MNKINLCALIIVLSSVTGVHHSMFVANFIYYVIHFSKEEGGLVPTLLWRGSQSSLNCLVFSLVREFRSVLKAEAKRGDVRSLLTIPIVWGLNQLTIHMVRRFGWINRKDWCFQAGSVRRRVALFHLGSRTRNFYIAKYRMGD